MNESFALQTIQKREQLFFFRTRGEERTGALEQTQRRRDGKYYEETATDYADDLLRQVFGNVAVRNERRVETRGAIELE